jgi:transposase-like protein
VSDPTDRFRLRRIRELARQLMVGPAAVRRRQAERLEALLLELEPDRAYPYEFLYFRITGFRPQEDLRESFGGREVMADLTCALQMLTQSAPRSAAEAPGPVHTVKELAEELDVSPRTIRRWRQRGLVTATYEFPGGQRFLGVSQAALERFRELNPGLVRRSGQFSRLTAEEERRLVVAARQLVGQGGLGPTAVAARLAARTGRAAETVRLALLRHDREHPESPLFGGPPGRLDAEARRGIWTHYRQGTAVADLARRYGRSRSTIYRIINRQRAVELLDLPLAHVSEDAFREPDAEAEILGEDLTALMQRLADQPGPAAPAPSARTPAPLSDEEELTLFRAFNYARFRAAELRQEVNPRRYVPSALLERIEDLRHRAEAVRELLVRLHTPLAEQVARQHAGEGLDLAEARALARARLGRLVGSFDYAGRGRFPNYAALELMKAFAREQPPAPET